ncbi:MAG: Rne/Rng family ribonuclease [Candidatus Eremiobacterota bacterium]
MYKEILISIDEREGRAAVLEDGAVVEILIAREERQVGSIYKARVANVLPGMNAAFVDIGLERNAFLCADDAVAHLGDDADESMKNVSINDILKVNEETLVQVVKEAVGTKGARVTTYVTLPGRYLVLIPSAQYIGISRRVESEAERNRLRTVAEKMRPDGMGLIVRTAASGRSDEELSRDLDFLVRSWNTVLGVARWRRAPALVHQELALVDKIVRDLFTSDVNRLILDNPVHYGKIREKLELGAPNLLDRVHLYTDTRPLFEFYGVEGEIEKALKRKVWLDSGGYLIIERTEALWVIDVNTGKFTGKTNLADTILRNNLEAAREICRQLRLRDMGGIIIVDFIDMEHQSDRRKVLDALTEELRKDRTRTHLVGMTELGLVQLTRKREGKDLDAVMREACTYCSGRGRVLSVESIALRARRELKRQAQQSRHDAVLITVHPRVGVALVGYEGEEIEGLERDTGKSVYLRVDREVHVEHFDIQPGKSDDLKQKLHPLTQGRKANVRLEDNYGINLQSALAVIDGNLVEVVSGGDKLGKQVEVRVTAVGRSFSRAEVTA